MKFLFVLVVAFSLLLTGCGGTHRPKSVSMHLGMSKTEVRSAMGKPQTAPRSILNKFDQTIEVWEYSLDRGFDADGYYWLYFCEGKLFKWSEAGDWQKEAKRIYETRIVPPTQ